MRPTFLLFGMGAALLAGGVVGQTFAPRESVANRASPPLEERGEARLLFVGDLFFDRHIRLTQERFGADWTFSCLGTLLQEADAIVGNLEGPITDQRSVSAGTAPGSADNYVFTFPTSTAPLLFEHRIRIVNLGNNHIGNFGEEGVRSTKRYLTEAGVAFFGGLKGDEEVHQADIGGVPFSFVSYNAFGGSTAEEVAHTISRERALGREVVLYAHWGEEYEKDVSRLRPLARLFVSSGASAVIGSHPHVVQESERIGSAPVFYSLGNFIFDQYFNEEVSRGLAVELRFTDAGIETAEYQVSLERDGRTCPLNENYR